MALREMGHEILANSVTNLKRSLSRVALPTFLRLLRLPRLTDSQDSICARTDAEGRIPKHHVARGTPWTRNPVCRPAPPPEHHLPRSLTKTTRGCAAPPAPDRKPCSLPVHPGTIGTIPARSAFAMTRQG